MNYKVVKAFSDLLDSGYKYSVGDEYPRAGLVVTKGRIKELSTINNKRGVVLIAEMPLEASPLTTEVHGSSETGESPISTTTAKERPRKSRKNNNA